MSSFDSTVQEVSAKVESGNRVQFPEIIDGKINTEEFLQASRDVVQTVCMYNHFIF